MRNPGTLFPEATGRVWAAGCENKGWNTEPKKFWLLERKYVYNFT